MIFGRFLPFLIRTSCFCLWLVCPPGKGYSLLIFHKTLETKIVLASM
jgi:hypothetical protein